MNRLINFMDRLTSRTVIQTNATVIAGLLILLTLQSLSAMPFLEEAKDIDRTVNEKKIEIDKYTITIDKLKRELNSINNTDRKVFYQTKIDEMQVQVYLLEEEVMGLSKMGSDWFQTTVEKNGIIEAVMNTRMAVLLMVTPFAISAMTEIYPSKHEREKEQLSDNEKATKMGKFFLCLGFLGLIIGLAFIFSQPL